LATDDVAGEWFVELHHDGFTVSTEPGGADAALVGPAAELMKVLYRRAVQDDRNVTTSGDVELIDFWLAHSALE
jgi:predicted lipid carrier protein YhbT